jgi:hypothetical protein
MNNYHGKGIPARRPFPNRLGSNVMQGDANAPKKEKYHGRE